MAEYRADVWQDGLRVAQAWAANPKSAVQEGLHYAAVYAQDGPKCVVKLWQKNGRHWRRGCLTAATPAPEQPAAIIPMALEEAAQKVESLMECDPDKGVPLRSPGPHEIAAAIRAIGAP